MYSYLIAIPGRGYSMGRPQVDAIGQTFGRLVVTGEAPRCGSGARRVVAHCDCGTELTVRLNSLRTGNTSSCGQHGKYRVVERGRKNDGWKRRRALERAAPGRCTGAQRRARWEYYLGRCWMCGHPADCMDHVKPLIMGGSRWPSNLRPACRRCNRQKADHWPWPSFADLYSKISRGAALPIAQGSQ